MKNKALIIIAVIFFIAINTTYFWEHGLYDILITLILIIVFIGLAFAFIQQFYLAVKEKFRSIQRLVTIFILITVLILSYLFPNGLINLYKFSGKDVLIAGREGVANCMTTD